jgi:hypothetical protein
LFLPVLPFAIPQTSAVALAVAPLLLRFLLVIPEGDLLFVVAVACFPVVILSAAKNPCILPLPLLLR